MKVVISPAEMQVLNEYGIHTYGQLREVVAHSNDERLVKIFLKTAGLAYSLR